MSRIITLSLVLISFSAFSQNYLKTKSADYLRRSAYIVQQAHKELFKLDSAKRDGKFATAVAHQRMARRCFQVNDFKQAVYHSAYARRLAILVVSSYNPMLNSKFKDTPEEMQLAAGGPSEDSLKKDLLKANPGIQFKDADYMGDNKLFKLDVDDLVQP